MLPLKMGAGVLHTVLPAPTPLHLPDMRLADALVFVLFYRHIYGQKVNITADSVLELTYAATKYILKGLVAECTTVLEKLLSVDTVCIFLNKLLWEEKLKKKFLKFVSAHARSVLDTGDFLHISYDALEEIVSLDCLVGSSERQLYERCVKWAIQQLCETGNESPSDEEIRNKLGSVLYKIRFPTMTQKDFAELTAQSAVLTAEEKHDVYVYIAVGMTLETLKFGTQRRQMTNYAISRFDRIRGAWSCNDRTDAVSIQTTENIVLTGVGLYGGIRASTHDVTLMVLKENGLLSNTQTKMVSDGSQKPIKINLEKPVCIRGYTVHTVMVVLRGPSTWAGEGGLTSYAFSESGRITFRASRMSETGTTVTHGQIPQLFYY